MRSRSFRLSKSVLPLIICIQLLLPAGLGFSQPAKIAGIKYASPRPHTIEVTPQTLPGLQSKVEVLEDDLGISHVFAKKNDDAFFMQGFLHARDRFFQMDVMRRTAEGTLAELIGAGPGNSNLINDGRLRGLGLKRAAGLTLPLLRPET